MQKNRADAMEVSLRKCSHRAVPALKYKQTTLCDPSARDSINTVNTSSTLERKQTIHISYALSLQATVIQI